MKKSKGLSLRENADSTKPESAPPAQMPLASRERRLDKARICATRHEGATGSWTNDYRSADYGLRSLQVDYGNRGGYADTDMFDPYNPGGLLMHGAFEVLPGLLF